MITPVPRHFFSRKAIFLSLVLALFCRGLISDDFSPQLEWIKRKCLTTRRFSEEEFGALRNYLYELLKKDINKDDLYAILVCFSQARLTFREFLILLEEVIALVKLKSIPSRKLRNFLYGRVKLARANGKKGEQLVLFLIGEIRKLKQQ